MRAEWPLVGRRRELARLDEALDGPGLVVAGDAGVGKSRLVREALLRAEQHGDATVLVVASGSLARLPFGAVAHLLPAEVPRETELGNVLRRCADALLAAAAGDRLVIGVDDAHLLDAPSAALLHHVAAHGGATVIAAVRSGEPAPDSITALWTSGLLPRIDLVPLTREDADALAAAALGGLVDGITRRTLWRATRGNPLLLHELVRSCLDSGMLRPCDGVWHLDARFAELPRLGDLVDARLGHLGDAERAALELVAAAEPLEAALAEAVVAPGALAAVERRGLVAADRSGRRARLRLVHPLYGEVLRARTPVLRCRDLHRDLAAALAASGARRREDLLRLASWRLEAGIAEDPDLLVAGAERAAAAHDHVLAERLAQAAVDAGGGLPALRALGEAVLGQGRLADAARLAGTLRRSGAAAADRAQAQIAALSLAWYTSRESAARSATRRPAAGSDGAAAGGAGAGGDALSLDDLTAVRASYLLSDGSTREACEVACALVERDGVAERPLVLAAIMAGWSLAMVGRCERSIALLRDVEQRISGEVPGFPFTREWLRATRYAGHFFAGRLGEAEATMAAVHREAVEADATAFVGAFGFHLGHVRRVQGRLAEAEATLREAAARLRELDLFQHLPACLAELAHCAALRGDVPAAERLLAEAEACGVRFRPADAQIALAGAWTAAARGERSSAQDLALRAAAEARAAGQLVNEAIALHDVVRLGRRGGLAERLGAIAGRVDGDLVPLLARHAAAVAAGRGDDLDAVAAGFERLGSPLLAAEASAAAAAAHRAAGRPGSALAAAGRSRQLAGRCGEVATPALARADADHGLTPREEEVAALAARGLTSPEIAARLVISVRTVDNHLSRAYAKLGITGRHHLPEILAAPGSDARQTA